MSSNENPVKKISQLSLLFVKVFIPVLFILIFLGFVYYYKYKQIGKKNDSRVRYIGNNLKKRRESSIENIKFNINNDN